MDTDSTQSPDLKAVYHMHAELCKALANDHRQAILHAIGDGEKCVGDLAAEIGISVHNVSQHLRVLKERGLVTSRKEAQAAAGPAASARPAVAPVQAAPAAPSASA
jgi:predicted ArsR family transcriptional regulator